MFIQLFASHPRHAWIGWIKLEEHRRSFSVLESVKLFSVLLWGNIVHIKGLLLAFYLLVFVVTKGVCGCFFRWAIDAFNTRVIRTAATAKLGVTQACFELLLLLQLEAVAMMAHLSSLNLSLSLSLPVLCESRIDVLTRAEKEKQGGGRAAPLPMQRRLISRRKTAAAPKPVPTSLTPSTLLRWSTRSGAPIPPTSPGPRPCSRSTPAPASSPRAPPKPRKAARYEHAVTHTGDLRPCLQSDARKGWRFGGAAAGRWCSR
jgi:hypothetical protein